MANLQFQSDTLPSTWDGAKQHLWIIASNPSKELIAQLLSEKTYIHRRNLSLKDGENHGCT
jgi:hypothetical protein